MGISPVYNLIPLPEVSSAEGAFEPRPMERVERSSRMRDESYSPSGGQAGGEADGRAREEEDAPQQFLLFDEEEFDYGYRPFELNLDADERVEDVVAQLGLAEMPTTLSLFA